MSPYTIQWRLDRILEWYQLDSFPIDDRVFNRIGRYDRSSHLECTSQCREFASIARCSRVNGRNLHHLHSFKRKWSGNSLAFAVLRRSWWSYRIVLGCCLMLLACSNLAFQLKKLSLTINRMLQHILKNLYHLVKNWSVVKVLDSTSNMPSLSIVFRHLILWVQYTKLIMLSSYCIIAGNKAYDYESSCRLDASPNLTTLCIWEPLDELFCWFIASSSDFLRD